MRTGEVEFKGIWSSLLSHLGQGLPVILVIATHDAGDHNLVGEVPLDLCDASEIGFNV